MHKLASDAYHLFHTVISYNACNASLSLFSSSGVGQVSQSLFALEFSVLDHSCLCLSAMISHHSIDTGGSFLPASASEEKCADHCTKVDPWLSPLVTAWHLIVEITLEYVRAGVEEMTE